MARVFVRFGSFVVSTLPASEVRRRCSGSATSTFWRVSGRHVPASTWASAVQMTRGLERSPGKPANRIR